jgi:hypothetical protein
MAQSVGRESQPPGPDESVKPADPEVMGLSATHMTSSTRRTWFTR